MRQLNTDFMGQRLSFALFMMTDLTGGGQNE